jgi:cold shock CspA family protein
MEGQVQVKVQAKQVQDQAKQVQEKTPAKRGRAKKVAEQVQAEQVQAEPVQSEQVQAEPVQAQAEQAQAEPQSKKQSARVKWFNAKSGFGFATVLEGTLQGQEIFVHHSEVTVNKEQFRYLVEGEYVDLEIKEATKGDHKYQGSNITGILGGQLMCETRNESSEMLKKRTKEEGGEYITPSRERRDNFRREGSVSNGNRFEGNRQQSGNRFEGNRQQSGNRFEGNRQQNYKPRQELKEN